MEFLIILVKYQIPTDTCSTEYSKFIQKYWWLRSPLTNESSYAFVVIPSGDVSYGVHDGFNVVGSYGRRSPFTYSSDDADLVFPFGSFNGYYGVSDSYG